MEIVLKFLPKKKEDKNARHTQSRRFVALLLCNDWIFLCCHLQERISCCIARSKQKYFLHLIVILQGSKQWQ
jgi:hypothetical protein